MENRIKERTKEAGVMQKDLAERLGMTAVGFNQIASSTMPKIETFVKVAEALGVPVWSLLLTDDELESIRSTTPKKNTNSSELQNRCDATPEFQCPKCNTSLKFRCPKCGASLKVILDDIE